MSTIKLKATDGSDVMFDEKLIAQGGMKDIYFSPDHSYVVGFFRDKQGPGDRDRLVDITGKYRDKIFNQVGGEYWKTVLCWPNKIVEHKGRLGVVAPVYDKQFFFKYGSTNNDFLQLAGKEKEGKWFACALHQNRNLDPRERGDWRLYLGVCIKICRAVRRLHAAGLAHSDLSYKNVLIDPCSSNANIIDLDGLVVPGKHPPGVVGTPDFIAPEVVQTQGLLLGDPKKQLPRRETDQHALAVLVYMYLLYRHPLRGRLVHDLDDTVRDEQLAMGEKALFVEHPKERSNRYDINWVKKNEGTRAQYLLPWQDLDVLPYKILGPHLSILCERAFVDGLHNPTQRPSADDWETALVKTLDLLQPCQNPACKQKWFVFDNKTKPICPFCKTAFKGQLPILNLYYKRGDKVLSENQRLMVYNNQYLSPWHTNRNIFPNEKLSDAQKKAVGYFKFDQGHWWLVNQSLTSLKDLISNKDIKQGDKIELVEGKKILLSNEEGGRVILVQLVNA